MHGARPEGIPLLEAPNMSSEIELAIGEIMDGGASDAVIGAFLVALKIKGAADTIGEKFIDGKFADSFLTFQDRIEKERKRSARRKPSSIK